MDFLEEYRRWQEKVGDKEIKIALTDMNETEIEDAFYRNLEFGTGGLRGIIGAGTNRLNLYTVAKASQGLANYLNKNYEKRNLVAIGYDSRIKSEIFARKAAEVFAGNGLKVMFWPHLIPVPTLSFTTRYYGCSAGVMITASHNPAKYNGYKVYNDEGCQITTGAATEILKEIEKLDIFDDVKLMDFDSAVDDGMIEYVADNVMTAFIEAVKEQSSLYGDNINKDVSIVYSPLNGAGYVPVTRALKEQGFNNVIIVEEQRLPDGNFPTCPYPNPEIKETLKLGLDYCRKYDADIMLATDPDCDRVGVAVKSANGEYKLLTGNEVGLLLLNYMCAQKCKHNKMPEDPVLIKTVVTTDMAERIATKYGLRTINVLTGFKFIGEQIGLLERAGKADSYVLGFEESNGYLTGTYIRDKDAVNGATMIVEMFAYYKTRGISLLDKLDELHKEFGHYVNSLYSYAFEGATGFEKMKNIMTGLRNEVGSYENKSYIADIRVLNKIDYLQGVDGLPQSDVIKLTLDDNCSVVVRPSGTEPKLKMYISVAAKDETNSIKKESIIHEAMEKLIKDN